MRKITDKVVRNFNHDNRIFTPSESRQVIEIIIEREKLRAEQIEEYNFSESYSLFGTTWMNTISLANYVQGSLNCNTEREIMKGIMDTPELFLLSTGRWVGWDY